MSYFNININYVYGLIIIKLLFIGINWVTNKKIYSNIY